jgi:dephospho-CoA kinase
VTRPFCVALTGGIGSGKSLAADFFTARGAVLVDTDRIAHALTASGGAALPELIAAFGSDCISNAGALDRAWMAAKVFEDKDARLRLEAILHPMIRTQAGRQVMEVSAPYVILAVPLLVEGGAYADLADRVLVIDCPESVQFDRVMRRQGMTEARARAIMAAQASRASRLAIADDVIVNDTSVSALESGVDRLHTRYLELASHRLP